MNFVDRDQCPTTKPNLMYSPHAGGQEVAVEVNIVFGHLLSKMHKNTRFQRLHLEMFLGA